MELVTEKGHMFAEERQKVSSIIFAHDRAFGACDLNCQLAASPGPLPLCITVANHS